MIGGSQKGSDWRGLQTMEDTMLHSTHIDLKNKSLSELYSLLRQAFNAAASAQPGSPAMHKAEAIKRRIKQEISDRML